MITLYGLKNCDTCRKALKALKTSGVDVSFHDVRDDGVNAAQIQNWIDAIGYETLLNTRSTTWRGLDAQDKEAIDAAKAHGLMLTHPTLIKRPVIEKDGAIFVGWAKQTQQALL